MPDLDLAAIRVAVRAVIAKVRALPVDCTALTGPVWWGDGWKQALDTVEEFADAWPDDGDDLAALVAEHRQLADRLREAVAERDRLRVSRDDWRAKALGAASMQRFVIGGDCPETGCRGQRVEIAAFGRADPVAVVLDCGHELPEAVRAPESLQNPPTQPEPHGRPERP